MQKKMSWGGEGQVGKYVTMGNEHYSFNKANINCTTTCPAEGTFQENGRGPQIRI